MNPVFVVEYAATRRELWIWYWRQWRRQSWKRHATILVVITLLVLAQSGASPSWSTVAIPGVIGLGVIGFEILYPQIHFKPQLRTLAMGADGINTTIMHHTQRVSWHEVKSVMVEDGYVVITRHAGNAFVVPPRAFASTADRDAFATFAMKTVVAGIAHIAPR